MSARPRQARSRLIGGLVGGLACVISAGAAAQESRLRDLLSGAQPGASMTFAVPKPKQKIYGGTEDIRWMAEVEGMLEVKAHQLPAPTGVRAGEKIALCFEVDLGGHTLNLHACGSPGHRRLEAFARRVVTAATPFPPPPATEAKRGLMWVYAYDGSVSLRFR